VNRGIFPFIIFVITLWLGNPAQSADFGHLDANFAPALGSGPAEITGLEAAPYGKYFVWGKFHRVGEIRRINLARMNADGTLDESFNAGLNALSYISKVTVQADGCVLIMGSLYLADGTILPKIVRVMANGRRDETFQLPENVGLISSFTLVPESQKILLNGLLLPTNNVGSAVLLRLESNGSIDTSFTSAVKRGAFSLIQPLSGGKLLVEGFLSLSSVPEPDSSIIIRPDPIIPPRMFSALTNRTTTNITFVTGPTSIYTRPIIIDTGLRPRTFTLSAPVFRRTQLWRLNADGSLDDTFSAAAIFDSSVTPGPQDVIYSGYNFSNGDGTNGIALNRFEANGQPDASFRPALPLDVSLSSIAPLSDGKLLVTFSTESLRSENKTILIRLNHDGTPDNGFQPSTNSFSLDNARFVEQSDGSVRVVDYSNSIIFSQGKVAKVNSDGTVETNFGTPLSYFPGANSLVPTSNGQIYASVRQTNANGLSYSQFVRLYQNGSRDDGFSTISGEMQSIDSPKLLPAGDLIVSAYSWTNYTSTLLRLNNEGKVLRELAGDDYSFMPYSGNWVAFPDGRIAIARNSYGASEPTPWVKMYTSEFEVDNIFTVVPDLARSSIQINLTPDGKLLTQGFIFNRVLVSGEEVALNTIESVFERLLPNGETDTSFLQTSASSDTRSVATFDASGKYYTTSSLSGRSGGGGFGVPNNDLPVAPDYPPIQRYLINGALDTGFNVPFQPGSSIRQICVQKDGRILVCGVLFATNSNKIKTLVRLLPDGSLDESFALPENEVVPITNIAIETDGNILVGGDFDQIGDEFRAGLARLSSVEQPQMKNITFPAGRINIQFDGNKGRTWWIQASDDLSHWTTVAVVTTGASAQSINLPTPATGKKFYRAVLAPVTP